MFIKYDSRLENKTSVINVNINNAQRITTYDNNLVFEMENIVDNVSFEMKDSNEAVKALNRLFDNLYNKAPVSNLLDLTTLDENFEAETNDSEDVNSDNSDFGEILSEEEIQ